MGTACDAAGGAELMSAMRNRCDPSKWTGDPLACFRYASAAWVGVLAQRSCRSAEKNSRALVRRMHVPITKGEETMKTITSSVLTAMLGIWASPAFCADPATGANKEPGAVAQYDLKTEITFTGSIVKVQEVAAGKDFAGVHVTIQSPSKELFEVYLAPASFIKMLDVPLKIGLREVDVTGSKITAAGGDLVLARELSIAKTTFVLRDSKGAPNWLWSVPQLPTGF
jgi:hypothetical protein